MNHAENEKKQGRGERSLTGRGKGDEERRGGRYGVWHDDGGGGQGEGKKRGE